MGGNDTIGRHLNPRLDDGVIGIAEVAVHRIDRLLALGDARTEPADIGVDAQAIDRPELRRQLGAPHLRVEILRPHERRAGKACVSSCRSVWSRYSQYKNSYETDTSTNL